MRPNLKLIGGAAKPAGGVNCHVIKGGGQGAPPDPHKLSLREIFLFGFPRPGLAAEVFRFRLKNLPHLMRGLWRELLARLFNVPHFTGQLFLSVIRANGERVEFGLASMRVVTTAGVNFIVDAFQNLTELEILKFHGIGTGVAAEAAADTALGTELTTQYNPDSTRATGSLTEGASANVYRTVGTNAVDAAVAITEHGIFSQAATGGGTLLDRSVFSAMNLASGDSLQTTYDLTVTAGG